MSNVAYDSILTNNVSVVEPKKTVDVHRRNVQHVIVSKLYDEMKRLKECQQRREKF